MSDAQFALAVLIVAPMAIVALIGMLRGYHVWLHIYKAPKGEERSDGKPSSEL